MDKELLLYKTKKLLREYPNKTTANKHNLSIYLSQRYRLTKAEARMLLDYLEHENMIKQRKNRIEGQGSRRGLYRI